MASPSLPDARAAVVRSRVLDGVAALLTAGDELTFSAVAKAAEVPERTVYRHFPTREALLTAVFEWANERIGFGGELPVDAASAVALVRKTFPGFEKIAPVIRELLIAPAGLVARLSKIEERRKAARAVVQGEVPDIDRTSERRIAAAVQLLTTAAAWQTLRDYWGMSGKEAGETAALAIELLLEGARARATRGAL